MDEQPIHDDLAVGVLVSPECFSSSTKKVEVKLEGEREGELLITDDENGNVTVVNISKEMVSVYKEKLITSFTCFDSMPHLTLTESHLSFIDNFKSSLSTSKNQH